MELVNEVLGSSGGALGALYAIGSTIGTLIHHIARRGSRIGIMILNISI